jgi:hypothetical protein
MLPLDHSPCCAQCKYKPSLLFPLSHQAAFHAALNAFKAKLRQQMEATYQKARRKLAASRERVAAEMLAAESSKLHALISGPGASVAVEIELRR